MNIYKRKFFWKLFLLVSAFAIGMASLLYTNKMVKELASEERKKVELWAEATQKIIESDLETQDFSFLLKVIENNTTVPVIVTDSLGDILISRNLDSLKVANDKRYVEKQLTEMKENYEPILIHLPGDDIQYLYYNRSTILTKLTYYPYVQLSVIVLFILVAYLAFSSSRKAEQNKVWIGLSKETAHQLGTPISSLLAWVEMLKTKVQDKDIIDEFEKDVQRLNKIADRFSKVGSVPKLVPHNLINVIKESIAYISSRTSNKVNINLKTSYSEINIPLSKSLLEWVIENLCKNGIDAMESEGDLNISVDEQGKHIIIDISDSGAGLPKSKHKTIFKPGYTTKKRGWGLGLSLSKRIIEEYHHGKIFVLNSEINKGTTFRITLNADNSTNI